jgi:2-iminobutanoate/2-iminopropanoate deaminase
MKEVIFAQNAPQPIGPYSQAINAGSMVFCSGQLGIDPRTGQLVLGGADSQTRQCLLNLQAVLAAAGCTLENVIKTTIYVTNMADFKDVNEVYAQFFPGNPPARSTVGVGALPMNAKVEIEAIAVR